MYTSLTLFLVYFAPLSLFTQDRSNGKMVGIIEIPSQHSSAVAEEIHEKSQSVSVVIVSAEIRIEDVPNTSLEHYPFDDRVGLPQFNNTIYLDQRSYNLNVVTRPVFLTQKLLWKATSLQIRYSSIPTES
jgi:hypothetical protein